MLKSDQVTGSRLQASPLICQEQYRTKQKKAKKPKANRELSDAKRGEKQQEKLNVLHRWELVGSLGLSMVGGLSVLVSFFSTDDRMEQD